MSGRVNCREQQRQLWQWILDTRRREIGEHGAPLCHRYGCPRCGIAMEVLADHFRFHYLCLGCGRGLRRPAGVRVELDSEGWPVDPSYPSPELPEIGAHTR